MPVPPTAAVPPPPPGPGVRPPFIAPPTDGLRRRRGMAIGLAAGAAVLAVLACVGGIGSLFYFGTKVVVQQQQKAVTEYLTAVQVGDYEAAYDMLCPAEQERISRPTFIAGQSIQRRISSFTVHPPNMNEATVRATVTYADGETEEIRFTLWQDAQAAEFRVCGQEG
jgi:hypothetical protein